MSSRRERASARGRRASERRASAADDGGCPGGRARDQRLCLSVTPIRRRNRLIIEVSALTPRSVKSFSHSAVSVMSGFSTRRAARNSPARLHLDPLIAGHCRGPARSGPLEALNPLDRRRQAHPKPRRRRPPADLAANHRVNHAIRHILRIRSSHPCRPRSSSQQVEAKSARFGNPNDSRSSPPALAAGSRFAGRRVRFRRASEIPHNPRVSISQSRM